jgi:hypothetical protein
VIEALLDRQRGLTPALARLSPQVSGLASQEESAVDAVKALTNALLFTAHQFNVVRNMAELQMGILADELLERYWFWRFDEFLYVLREGVAQTWGKTYDRLDPPTVHEWCRAYQELRDMQVEHEATREAQAYKKAEGKPAPSPLAAEPGYAALRAKVDAMSDAELMKGGSYYASIDCPTPEDAFKLAVATEVWQERMAAQQLAAIAESLPGRNLPSARELAAMEKAEDVQLELNMATGAYEAAGFKDFAGLQKLVAAGAPVAPAWHQVFAPACPRCTQRPDQCICSNYPPQAA